MSIISRKQEGYTVEFEIAVEAGALAEAAEKAFRKRVKSIAVPGFRKGKAPRRIIERMYGEGIFLEDAVNELYPSAYREAVEESGIDPVDSADIEMREVDLEKGFTFKATVTVKPEIEIGGYKALPVNKTVYTVEDSDIENEITRMREQNARIVAIENREAKKGDTAVIDFEGFIDGVPFAGGKGESHSLELGSGSFIPGFEDQVTGHSPGDEFDVNVTFPEEYHAEEMSGKAAVFKVKLIEIKERQLPEADDEFARDVSEFDTLDELRADIRRRQEESKARRSDDEMETKLIDTVVEGVKGEIPGVMFEHRIDEMVQDFDYRLRSQGMNIDIYLQYTGMDKDQFKESFRAQAERQVKIRLALEKIAALESFELSEEETEKQYEELAKTYSREIAEIKRVFSEKDVREDLLCKKASDLIRESAVVTEVPEEKAPAKEETPDDAAPEAGEEKPKKKPAAKKAPAKKQAEADGEEESNAE